MIAGDDPMMSLKNEIKKYALSQGAQLVGMTRVEVYADYLAEVEKRLQDRGNSGRFYGLSGGKYAETGAHIFF
jgi:hypothetical protein